MIVALLNQKGGVDKTTLATHIAGELALRGAERHPARCRPTGLGAGLDAAAQPARFAEIVQCCRPGTRDAAPGSPGAGLSRRSRDHRRTPLIAALARSALLAADCVLIPVQPSPYDLWASAEMVNLIREAQMFRPLLRAAFAINRRVSTTVIGREARGALADQPLPALPALQAEVRQRIVFAESVAAGRLARELAPDSAAAREVSSLVEELLRWSP